MGAEGRRRPAWAEVDLGALRRNVETLAAAAAPSSLCAVVKADAYGHGATGVVPTMLDAGATSLGVALVDEGVELREAGVTAPILLLSEVPATSLRDAMAADLTLTVGSLRGARELVAAAAGATVRGVHVKVDTGMHRQGVPPAGLLGVLDELRSGGVAIEAVWTHFPVADGTDEADVDFTTAQLDAFLLEAEAARLHLGAALGRHAANTAGLLAHPASRLDMVRAGLGCYGYLPAPAMAEALAALGRPPLAPVLSLKARVVAVRDLPGGSRPSYGRRRPLPHDARVATVPLGYADGVPRALLGAGAEVLVRGRRRPLAGTVTMDQLVVDCGDDAVEVGDEVVLLGRQGDEVLTADDWARWLGTISWEVLCGITPRVPRLAVS